MVKGMDVQHMYMFNCNTCCVYVLGELRVMREIEKEKERKKRGGRGRPMRDHTHFPLAFPRISSGTEICSTPPQ